MPHLSLGRLRPQICALLVLPACLAGTCVTAFSAEVRLAWDAKTESDLAGYKLYYGIASNSDVKSIDVGNVTTYLVSRLKPGTYRFCVTAYYTSGVETGCSNEVVATLSPRMYGFRDESGSSPVVGLPTDTSSQSAFNRQTRPTRTEAIWFDPSFPSNQISSSAMRVVSRRTPAITVQFV